MWNDLLDEQRPAVFAERSAASTHSSLYRLSWLFLFLVLRAEQTARGSQRVGLDANTEPVRPSGWPHFSPARFDRHTSGTPGTCAGERETSATRDSASGARSHGSVATHMNGEQCANESDRKWETEKRDTRSHCVRI